MKNIIFTKYGIDIIKDEEKYYIKYDSGDLSGKEKESEISEEEALKAMVGPQEAYEVIIETQNRERGYKSLF
ncbi:hypothetical protein [Mixta gaviniae]|uniref:Uncharacterized protein n=1 Tax=Mixta gaviniae TaxID=665914 RepID=A0A1X1DFB1_9GAMM|nr:hypothetical protein [Mixta gaviniae]AUX95365.1 hypothetical protein C2E15_03695 [Mixta gaviniae]ORM75308.1 hypothetical protein HA44_18120 [Mixta gaviniae]